MVSKIILELRKIGYIILANFRVEALFGLGIIIRLIDIISGVAIYYFITFMFHGGEKSIEQYGTNVISYILLGMTMSPILLQGFIGIYNAIASAYADRDLERVMMTPTSISTLIASRMVNYFILSITTSILYLVVGITVFRIELNSGSLLYAVIVFIMGVISTSGLGMLTTQIFFHTMTGRGSPNHIIGFSVVFANAFTGVYFPVEVLPVPLRFISFLLPQTHAIRASRLILAGHGLNSVSSDLLYMFVFFVIATPIGAYLIKKGLEKIRKEGHVPRTGTFWLFG